MTQARQFIGGIFKRNTAPNPQHTSSLEQAPGFPGDKSKHKLLASCSPIDGGPGGPSAQLLLLQHAKEASFSAPFRSYFNLKTFCLLAGDRTLGRLAAGMSVVCQTCEAAAGCGGSGAWCRLGMTLVSLAIASGAPAAWG